jgi:hypothetical protein
MSAVPSGRDLEAEFFPRLKDLPPEVLVAIRAHSKRMFGNRDRLEVAVAITRVELGKVNATDLNREVDIAVNRVRSQLLVLESMHLLAETGGGEGGRRMFEVQNRDDPFWSFALNEFEQAVEDAGTRSPHGASAPDAPEKSVLRRADQQAL